MRLCRQELLLSFLALTKVSGDVSGTAWTTGSENAASAVQGPETEGQTVMVGRANVSVSNSSNRMLQEGRDYAIPGGTPGAGVG
jgi:hypothetical protein